MGQGLGRDHTIAQLPLGVAGPFDNGAIGVRLRFIEVQRGNGQKQSRQPGSVHIDQVRIAIDAAFQLNATDDRHQDRSVQGAHL